MNGSDAPEDHVQPFVCEDADGVALHFDLHSIQSRMSRGDPTALLLDYTQAMMAFALLQPTPRRLLMVGLGGGSLAKYCHLHLPEARIQVVEINPHVIALRQAFEVPPDSGRFQVLMGDGAAHVARLSEPVDVLLVDGFTYDGQPEELCSPDFYAACRRALTPEGVLVVNLPAADPRCAVWRDRVAGAFDGALLALPCGDGGNLVVLAGAPCRQLSASTLRLTQVRWRAADPRHRELMRRLAGRLAQAVA